MKKLRILPVLLSGLILSLFVSCEKPIEYYSYQKLNKVWQVQSASSAEPLSSVDLSKCKPKAKDVKNQQMGCTGNLTLQKSATPTFMLGYRAIGDHMLLIDGIYPEINAEGGELQKIQQTQQLKTLRTDLQGTWTYTLSGDTLTLSRSSDKAKMVWVSK